MRFQDYQEAAKATAGQHESYMAEIANFAMGLAGESGELVDALKKELFHGRIMSREHFEEEVGDILWYLANLCSARGLWLDTIAANNLKKLKKRYPDGFVKGGGIR